jgi:hypothetical protein
LHRLLRRNDLWPLPALLSWGLAWAGFTGLRIASVSQWLAFMAGVAIGAAFSLTCTTTRWRRLIVAGGFPLTLLARARCRFAKVRRGDPQRELAAGAWLASLEFEAMPLAPHAVLKCRDGRSLWLYRMQAKRT